MKFGRRYSIYVQTEAQRLLPECPFVEFKQLKKMLKKCSHVAAVRSAALASELIDPVDEDPTTVRDEEMRTSNGNDENRSSSSSSSVCPALPLNLSSGERLRAYLLSFDIFYVPGLAPECDAKFFSTLDKTVTAVVKCFNVRVEELLRLHLASGFRKYLVRLRSKISCDRETLMLVGNTLISYGCMNALAVRKILKKYDKIHNSETGQTFKSRLQRKRVEPLQSPMLIELSALTVNLMDSDVPVGFAKPGVLGCHISYNFENENKIISCVAPDGLRIDFDLTCSICLEIVFDPVALGCGHIFCNSCACAAGSVPTFQGATTARRSSKCPLCRQAGVYPHAVQLEELHTLVSNRWSGYCIERLPTERQQRLREAKEYWEKETQAFVGF